MKRIYKSHAGLIITDTTKSFMILITPLHWQLHRTLVNCQLYYYLLTKVNMSVLNIPAFDINYKGVVTIFGQIQMVLKINF